MVGIYLRKKNKLIFMTLNKGYYWNFIKERKKKKKTGSIVY